MYSKLISKPKIGQFPNPIYQPRELLILFSGKIENFIANSSCGLKPVTTGKI
jgi:hypothetical protein